MSSKQRGVSQGVSAQGKTAPIQVLYDEAVAHHRAGRTDVAEQLYRQVLARNPRHADSLHLLGVIALGAGRFEQAAQWISKAVSVNPATAAFQSNLGTALQNLGRWKEAVACHRKAVDLMPDVHLGHYNLGNALLATDQAAKAAACFRRAIQLRPDHTRSHNNLGSALRQMGELEAAAASFRAAVDLSPDFGEAHTNLGSVLQALGRGEEALASHRKALALAPQLADAHYNLGNALTEMGRVDEAVNCYRRAVELRPTFAEAGNNLGNALRKLGRLDEAAATLRRVIQWQADFAEAHLNLGNVLQELEHLDEAAVSLDRAAVLRPDFAEAHASLGNVLRQSGRLGAAAECYRRAVKLDPGSAAFQGRLGGILAELGRRDDAIVQFHKAVELAPDNGEALSQLLHHGQYLCRWDGLVDLETRVLDLVRRDAENIAPFSVIALNSTPADQLACARVFGRKHHVAEPLRADPAPARRLRIGYLSGDFREHPVAYLIKGMIERHDRERFEAVGYSIGRDDGGPTRRAMEAAFDRFEDLAPLSDREAAERIRRDGIDVLVDLMGYTMDSRSRIPAWRPAPVQVNYFGFPGTMGVDSIDYILADHLVIPSDHEAFYSEKVVRLPDSFMPFDPGRPVAETPTRAECGLPEEGTVFCAFHGSYKILPPLFDAWMRLLAAVPGSVLWLLAPSETAKGNLCRAAEARGIAAGRLVFAPRMEPDRHLARHRLADLFLDVLPYNAHTSGAEALWMGVPVVTCLGETFASRVAGSLLAAVGLPELVAGSLAEYEALALGLATDPAKLAEVTARLRAVHDSAPLFDAGRLTRNVEAAFARMVERHRVGLPPESFDVCRSK